MREKNLIMGVINNYSFYHISNFLFTLKQTNFKGHTCLFTGPSIGPDTIVKLHLLGIETVSYTETFPFINDAHPENFKTLPEPIHIYNYRHFLYYDYLLKNGHLYKNVLITDVKDVVFQQDPFQFGPENYLYVAMESPTVPLGDCEWNAPWLEAGYDKATFDALKDKQIICAGTTLAPTALMMAYLKRLLEEMFVIKDAYDTADQAMHNRLIYDNIIKPVKKVSNFEGPLLTMGYEKSYQLNKQKHLVNKDGSLVAVIHQYDRHPELNKLYTFRSDPYNLKKTLLKIYSKARYYNGRLKIRLNNLMQNKTA